MQNPNDLTGWQIFQVFLALAAPALGIMGFILASIIWTNTFGTQEEQEELSKTLKDYGGPPGWE